MSRLNWTEESIFIQKFKDWVENKSLKSFTAYWQQRNWLIVLQKLLTTFLMNKFKIWLFQLLGKDPLHKQILKIIYRSLAIEESHKELLHFWRNYLVLQQYQMFLVIIFPFSTVVLLPKFALSKKEISKFSKVSCCLKQLTSISYEKAFLFLFYIICWYSFLYAFRELFVSLLAFSNYFFCAEIFSLLPSLVVL